MEDTKASPLCFFSHNRPLQYAMHRTEPLSHYVHKYRYDDGGGGGVGTIIFFIQSLPPSFKELTASTTWRDVVEIHCRRPRCRNFDSQGGCEAERPCQAKTPVLTQLDVATTLAGFYQSSYRLFILKIKQTDTSLLEQEKKEIIYAGLHQKRGFIICHCSSTVLCMRVEVICFFLSIFDHLHNFHAGHFEQETVLGIIVKSRDEWGIWANFPPLPASRPRRPRCLSFAHILIYIFSSPETCLLASKDNTPSTSPINAKFASYFHWRNTSSHSSMKVAARSYTHFWSGSSAAPRGWEV